MLHVYTSKPAATTTLERDDFKDQKISIKSNHIWMCDLFLPEKLSWLNGLWFSETW